MRIKTNTPRNHVNISPQQVAEHTHPLHFSKEECLNYVQIIWWGNWQCIKRLIGYQLLYSSGCCAYVAAENISNPIPILGGTKNLIGLFIALGRTRFGIFMPIRG